jgi:hypothetical protein
VFLRWSPQPKTPVLFTTRAPEDPAASSWHSGGVLVVNAPSGEWRVPVPESGIARTPGRCGASTVSVRQRDRANRGAPVTFLCHRVRTCIDRKRPRLSRRPGEHRIHQRSGHSKKWRAPGSCLPSRLRGWTVRRFTPPSEKMIKTPNRVSVIGALPPRLSSRL